jgi:hypothetical protein
MHTIKTAMESAFKEFLYQHRQVPSTRFTLIQFDDKNDHDVVYDHVPIDRPMRLNLVPRGNTPLIDAFVKAIDSTGRRLRDTPEPYRPDQVLFVVITDGQENASKEYKRKDVFDRVTRQQNDYKWQFVYLGANQDAFAEAASYGIPLGSTLSYGATDRGVAGSWGGLTANTVSYVTNKTAMVPDFNDAQRKKAEDA